MKVSLLRPVIILLTLANSAYGVTTLRGTSGNNIGWQLSRQFNSPIPNGDSDTITYTITNLMPSPLVKPIQITKRGYPQNEFSYVDNCSGQTLTAVNQTGSSCLVSITLSPLVEGDKSFQLGIGGYSNKVVDLPSILTESFEPVVPVIGGVTGGRVIGYLEGWITPPTVRRSLTQNLLLSY